MKGPFRRCRCCCHVVLCCCCCCCCFILCFALLCLADIALPGDWAPMPRDPQTGNDSTVHLVGLIPGSPEYQGVVQQVQVTGGNVNITSIQRVQNPHLYQTYMVRKQKMDKDNVGRINERMLFHGTAPDNVVKINAQGFNRTFAGAKHGTVTPFFLFPSFCFCSFFLMVFAFPYHTVALPHRCGEAFLLFSCPSVSQSVLSY